MATILIETDLDVVSKQRQLVEEALGPDSVYIRMKETLIDLIDKSEIKGTDRAKVVADTIAQMSASITANVMNTGLQWAEAEKKLALQKTEMERQLDILDQNKLLIANQVIASLADRQLKQAQLRREYGTPTFLISIYSAASIGIFLLAAQTYNQKLHIDKYTILFIKIKKPAQKAGFLVKLIYNYFFAAAASSCLS